MTHYIPLQTLVRLHHRYLSHKLVINIYTAHVFMCLATLTHAFLYFRKQIWAQSRRALHEQPDIHARLMSRYPQGKRFCIIFKSLSATDVWQFPNGGISSSS